MTATVTDPAFELLKQASELERMRSTDDDRLMLLDGMLSNWEHMDRRWTSAYELVCHDHPANGGLAGELLALLVRITDDATQLLIDLEHGNWTNRDRAANLRGATERLFDIVRALTAVPLLSEER